MNIISGWFSTNQKEEPVEKNEDPVLGTREEETDSDTEEEEPVCGTEKEEPVCGTEKEEPVCSTEKEEPVCTSDVGTQVTVTKDLDLASLLPETVKNWSELKFITDCPNVVLILVDKSPICVTPSVDNITENMINIAKKMVKDLLKDQKNMYAYAIRNGNSICVYSKTVYQNSLNPLIQKLEHTISYKMIPMVDNDDKK